MENLLNSWCATSLLPGKFRKNFRQFLLMLLCIFVGAKAGAQTIGQYNFTSLAGATCLTIKTSVTTPPTGATFSKYLNTGGTCNASTSAFVNSNLNRNITLDLNEYNEFTITANSGYLLTLTSLKFTEFVSQNGSPRGTTWELRSSLDGFTSTLGSGTATTTSQSPTVNLPAIDFTGITDATFRLYVTSMRQSSTTWTNDNVILNGVVNQIPADPADPTSNSPQCVASGVTLTRTGTPPGGITWYWQTTPGGTSATGSAATYTAGASGTYYIRARNNSSLIWSTGEGSVSVIITPNVGAVSFSTGTSSTRCQAANSVTYTASATNAASYNYALNAASIAAGNSINALTGTVTYVSGWFGTSTITATATGCGPATNATHTVTTTAAATTPVFASGSSSTRCLGPATITYTATSSNTNSFGYSLDAASLAGGNTINALTGAVNFAAAYTGTLIVTATATGCNGTLTATHTVTITPTVSTPVFSAGTSSGRCQSAASVTYNATASNATSIAYALDATSTSAGNAINAATGSVTFVAGWTGTSTITVSAAGCSGPKTSTHTVTTTAAATSPLFTSGSSSTRCQGAATITYTATSSNTTSFGYSLDVTSIAGGNTINAATGAVTFAAAYTGSLIVTATATGCNGTLTATHNVTITPTVGAPVFSAGASSGRCQSAASVTYTATATYATSITYTLDAISSSAGNAINAATGGVTFVAGWTGTSVITATAYGCNGPATSNHTVTTNGYVTTPVFNGGNSSTRCQGGNAVSYTATANNTSGITYSLDAASLAAGNSIVAATGVVTYATGFSGTATITASAVGCSGPLSATHSVTITPSVATPVFTGGGSSTRCQGAGTVSYTASAANNTGIIYSLNASSLSAGNTIDPATGLVTYVNTWSGTSIIIASANGCNGPKTSNHNVTVTPTVGAPVFNSGISLVRCNKKEKILYDATSTNSTGITYSLDAASITGKNSINSSTGLVDYDDKFIGISYVTATATGCNGPVSTTIGITILDDVGDAYFPLGNNSTRCQGAGNVTYTAAAEYNTSITYTLDNASISGGNSINGATGEVAFVASWSGTTKITAVPNGCKGPGNNATHTVTVTPTVGTPEFTLGASGTRCEGSGNVTYTSTASNNTGLTYSLDATSVAAGNSINSSNGVVNYLAGWYGTSIITATATGCNGPVLSTHTVITNAYVTTPVFDLGNSTIRCQNAQQTTYEATASNYTSLTYSLDNASKAAGNSLNATTGAVTWAAGWFGTSTVTAIATGCSGPLSATHTISTTAIVGTPVFVYGASSLRCAAAVTVSYVAIATTAASVSYTLDAASLSAGNSIDAATGDVTYTADWSGISTITATANGCGTAVETHTATSVSIADKMVGAAPASVCSNTSSVITVAASQSGINYTLRDNATNNIIAGPSAGTGGALNFNTGNLTTAKTFNVLAEVPATSGALSFDGNNDFVKVPNAANLNPAYLSLECWVKINAYQAWSGLMVKADPTNWTNGYGLSMNSAGNKFAFFVNGYSNGFVTSTTTAALNTWYHVAATYDGVRTRIYVNGVLEATTNYAGTNGSSSNSLLLGGSESGTSFPLNGVIDEARVWNAALSAAQIQNNMNRTLSGTETNLAAYYPMENGTGSSVASDFVGGNNNGTLTNMNTSAVWVTRNITLCSQQMTVTPTVTITPAVTVPVFDAGAGSTRCQGVEAITYNATASNNTSLNYSLDNTSLTAGNTIDAATGLVNWVAGWSGSSTITATAAGCSGPATANHTVSTTPTVGTPVFTLGASSKRCQGSGNVTYTSTSSNNTGLTYSLDATSVAAGNSINSSNGVVSYVVGWYGTSSITVTATGCNGPVSSTHTVTTNAYVTTPVFDFGSSTIRCQNAQQTTYNATASNYTSFTYSLDNASKTEGNTINAATGAVTWAAGWFGTSTVTATAAGCSGPLSATHTITTTATVGTPVFALGTSSSRCHADGIVTYTATATTNTGISYRLDNASLSAGNSINAATGTVTYVDSWEGTSVITVTATGCNGPKSASHTVTTNASVGIPAFVFGSTTVRCQAAGTVTYTANASATTGIIFSLDNATKTAGNTINAATGAVAYVAGWAGTSVITATAAGCYGPSTSTHTITTTPTVGTPLFSLGSSSIRCQGAAVIVYNANATTTTGITYSLNNPSLAAGNTINASTGEVTYVNTYSGTTIITASATGCNGPATAIHTVTVTPSVQPPVFSLGASSTRCQNGGNVTYSATANFNTGLTFSLDAASMAAGNFINVNTGRVTYLLTWSGTSTITATATGCNGPLSAIHTSTTTPTVGYPVFDAGTSTTRCQGANTTVYAASATNMTSIAYSLDFTSSFFGNAINSSTGAVTFTSGWYGALYVTATAQGCNGPYSTTLTVNTTRTVTTPIFDAGASSVRCRGAGSVTYNATASFTSSITYSLDAASLAAGNTINPTNGQVNFVEPWSGTSVITSSAAGCSGPKTATHTVTVNEYVAVPIFTAGASSTRCQGGNTVVYGASATNTSGITYTLDLASRTAGNTINSVTGAVSFSPTWSGTSNVTASAAGCLGPKAATHTITTTATVGNPVFSMGASSVRCQGAGAITYTATATTNTGLTYSINAASIAGGNTINAATGEVTYVASFSGTSIITATATGCNGPVTSTHTVTVTATVGTPVFTLGASTTRCQGYATITYTATASSSTSINYALDAYSLSQGNLINPANGVVTFAASYSGTSVITATANGCNGPSVASHTVTLTQSVNGTTFVMGLSSTRCRAAQTITYSATANNTTGITYSLDITSRFAGNTINTATGAVTFVSTWNGTSTITASAAGCNGPDITFHTVATSGIVATPVFTMGATSIRCQAAATIVYTATAANNTGLTYTLDAASIAAGNTINAATGAVTYTAAWAGTTVITASASGCGGPTTASHTATTTATSPAPVFTMGASSSRCNGAGTVTYTATASTTITYTIDAASIAGGNTINSSTGVLNYASGWVGTTTITATAAGCGNPSTTHSATSTPNVAAPAFTLGSSSSRCQGAGSTTYTAASGNATGITYSLDAASIAAGNTIVTATGQVTFLATFNGTSTVTASAAGCNGPSTSTHTISILGNGTPVFDLGSSSTRMQAAGTVVYSANANNGSAVTYSLDLASVSAGNSINASTGAVTFSATWSGNSVITANSVGCNGNISSIHTVTTTPNSVFKQLYLSDPAQALDRVDPVATADATTASTTVLALNAKTTFNQSPLLCSPLIIKTGRNITITAYVTINSGTMPANPNVTAVLRYGATTIKTVNNPTYSGGLLTWTTSVAADVTVPAGQAISLDITNTQSGVTFTVLFDSQTKPSKIQLPVSTYIDIVSLDVYNAPYPGGIAITGAVSGTTNYIRAVVSDPFGSSDITGLTYTLAPIGGTVNGTSVATSGCTRTYEYVWKSPATSSYFDITAIAKEGFENAVTATKKISFSNCTDCPPIANDDSATGAGGTPIIIDALANDTDPNNNINTGSIFIVTQPNNGNVFISNNKIVYLPNGTFAGTDVFTYQICDLTSPTPLCASATVKIDIDPTIVDPCSESAKSHIYYLPFPEQDARTALIASSASQFLPIPSNNIRDIISVKIPYPGMVIIWDHWEDGYEANITSPTQSTTKIWGDGNPYNGIAPGYPNDIIPAGGSIILDNTMPSFPRNAANIFYDGKDKVYSNGEIALAQVLGEPSIIGVQCMKTNVSSTAEFGKSFTIPVGQDFASQDFKYTALFIRASENNTEVNIDKDNNGTFETTTILNEGQSLLVNGGVLTGATVTSSAPIGVDLHFGGVDGYSSREVPIFPATWYSATYYTPVPSTAAPDTSVIMLYNNLNRPITITYYYGVPTITGNFILPPKKATRVALPISSTNALKLVNLGGESFTAIEIVDSYSPGSGGNSGTTFDWAFNLIAEERLTTFATIAWAPGSTDGSRNDNPIWVTPAQNTTIYVKYNGDVLNGGSVTSCGLHYDVSYPLSYLKYKKIYDPNDNDQSGIAIFTCDGTKIAAVYGEDPSTALDANPSWDVGTTIKPYCAQKILFANDDYAYTLTDRAVTIPVLSNDGGFTAVIDPSTLTVAGLLAPKHGTVKVNANGTLLYTPNAGYTGLDSLQYNVCSTPVQVCDFALVIIKVNGCPTPANQNIISGQVFLDINKDGLSNDGKVGYTPAMVYLYADANCNSIAEVNELKDSVSVDSSGSYQFITYPERIISDNFDNPNGTASCATGSDGTAVWATNWVDAGDISTGFCVSPAQSYANTDVEMIADGTFGYAIRLKDRNKSATRTININGSSAAFLSFSYRRAKTSLVSGRDVYVQVSTNGSAFSTIFTISGNGTADAGYENVSNLDILSYASTNTYIRFLTNNNVGDADEVFIDNVSITYLKYPICYITSLDATSISTDYYTTTATKNVQTAVNGGTCLFPFDFGVAKKYVTVSGTLYNDVNGLTDNLVNGTTTGAPSGNTVYAYLVNSAGKVEAKTTVNSLSGAYSFTRAEVKTNFTIVLSTSDVAIGANKPSTANLPSGWVAVGDSYGVANNAGSGNEAGTPDLSIALNVSLSNVTGINFGIEQMPTAGNGTSPAINPGGTINLTVPPATFSNGLASSDPSPGVVSSILISSFPTNTTSITINGIMYTVSTFPAGGVLVPVNALKQPTQTILVDPVNGMGSVVIPFYAVDNAGVYSSITGKATLVLVIDTDRDGVPDNIDIDDDNDGIPDVIEVCGNGATSFSCTPGSKDPSLDNDGDGIVNWQDADYAPLNANGCTASLDKDGDGVPDFLDLDSDNDGIPDVVEAFGADANGDGVIDNFTDTDGDGLSQNVDANNTGAAGSGNGLGFVDLDNDGVPNSLDLDSDGDGLPDILEAGGTDANNDGRLDVFVDSDFDGLADSVDGDANNDFIAENTAGPLLKTGTALANGKPANYPNKNTDRTGRPNPYDLDSDGDGLSDVVESGLSSMVGVSNGQVSGGKTNGWANSIQVLASITLRNSDGRGPVDYLDIDSDDDGISDNIEAQSTNGYIVPTDADNDGDGIADVYDISFNSYGGNGLTPYDNDGDGTPDYLDTDSDNDGAPDLNEASRYFTLTQANINSVDTDGDGLLNEFDMLDISSLAVNNIYRNLTNSNFGPLGNYNGPLPSGSNVKVVKSDAKMNDRDWRNIVVLPTQIVSFNGVNQNSLVTLKWSVQNETEIERYEVERSINGIEFSRLSSQPALNRNSQDYSYVDAIFAVNAPNVYYRIKQVNKSGQEFLTNVVTFKLEQANISTVNAFPNPFTSELNLTIISKVAGSADIKLMDMRGRAILTKWAKIESGKNQVTIPNLGGLAQGMFIIEVKLNGQVFASKVVKQ